jgi:glycosyltransferase involved in cell wall biosynthesis
MRLLLWHWGRRGGGPRYTFELARAFRQLPGIEPHLSLSRQSELFAPSLALGLPGHHVDTYTGAAEALRASLRLPAIRAGFGRYVRAQGIEMVLCTMAHLWNLAISPRPARYVLTVHDAEPHPGEASRLRDLAMRADVARADHVIALTAHVKAALCRRFGTREARISVSSHGAFDYGAHAPAPRAGAPLRLLFFGRILAYKGLDRLLAARAMLAAAGTPTELTIAGQGDLSPHAGALADARVINRWIGEDEIAAIFSAHDVLVQPYGEASQSGVIAVACAAGMPAVVTPVGGLVEQVQHERSGLVAEAVSAEAIAAAIGRLAHDPALVARLGAGARAHAADALAWPAIATRLAEVLRAVRPGHAP